MRVGPGSGHKPRTAALDEKREFWSPLFLGDIGNEVVTEATGLHRTRSWSFCLKSVLSGRNSDSTGLHRKAARVYETEGHRFESCRARSRIATKPHHHAEEGRVRSLHHLEAES